ncbi:hypothetical protein [Aquibium sp. ELW1220]|uniref:hypothetical protein n=1 Tax=Aquibium sp. ELW1220 TaxID=2976766 RepID=UPI0025B04713|nr:hypothetical protein [Aquibium sp. ELW1220]MDN2579017.1 hypothetical protein [Aquibium sp. ELW1220]
MAEPSGLIPVGQAARLLMISEERIRQLVKQGYVPRSEKRGNLQLVGSVPGYLRYLKDDERRSAKSAADSRVRDAGRSRSSFGSPSLSRPKAHDRRLQ